MTAESKYPYNLILNVFSHNGDLEKDILDGVEKAMDSLSEREKEVLIKYFKDKRSYQSIGKDYNVHQERIRQIVAKALRKMRHPVRSRLILFGLDGYEHVKRLERKEYALKVKENELNAREKILEEHEKRILKNNKSNAQTTDLPNSSHSTIDELDLSVRAFNALRRADYYTIDNVITAIRTEKIYKIRNLGRKSFDEIMTKLMDYTGLTKMEIMEGQSDSYS